MRIFNNLRFNSLEKANIRKYLKYAFGEIILVVLGILIALQINNYKQKRSEQNKLKHIIEIIISDLEEDTSLINIIDHWYDERTPLRDSILAGTMSFEQLDTSKKAIGLLFSYYPFEPKQTGYKLISNYEGIMNSKNADLLLQVIQFYDEHIKFIQLSKELLTEDISNNAIYYKENYSWYGDLMMNKYSKEYTMHALNDLKFRNKLVHKKILDKKNYRFRINRYYKQAIKWADTLKQVYD